MRAYAELEADGLIETRAGSPARVRADHRLPDAFRDAAVTLVTTARQEDMTMPETLQAIQALWPEGDSAHASTARDTAST
jgi:DNA-binding FadR family transcriptional regulator